MHQSPARVLGGVVVLLVAVSATADVVTAGPDGDYLQIGDAIFAVRDIPGAHEIRIQAGTHPDYLFLNLMTGVDITLTGGWDATFTARSRDPADTLLIGPAWSLDYALTIDAIVDSSLRFEDLTFSRIDGTGVVVAPAGSSNVEFRNCVFAGSSRSSTWDERGGGMRASVGDTVRLVISGCSFSGNSIVTTSLDPTSGAGASIEVRDDATLSILHSRFTGNSIETGVGGTCGGVGLDIEVRGSSHITLEGVLIAANASDGCTSVLGEGLRLDTCYPGTQAVVDAHGLRVWDNTAPGLAASAAQLWTDACFTSTVAVADSVVAGGDVDGLNATAHDTAQLRLTGLTIAENANTGLVAVGNGIGTASLYNTVLWANGTDMDAVGDGTSVAVLTGVDPNFVDPVARLFVPQSPTDAEDGGSSSPPEGLSSRDASGCPRVSGSAPDIGAYEVGSLFGDGLESADTAAWSAVVMN